MFKIIFYNWVGIKKNVVQTVFIIIYTIIMFIFYSDFKN